MNTPQHIAETERLVLREFCLADAASLYRLNLDPEVLRFTGNAPFTSVEEAEQFVSDYNHYRVYGFGRWAVLLKEEQRFIGWCGLKFTPEKNEHDIGFRFFKQEWNKGYATEAARCSLQVGFHNFGLKTILGRAMLANQASINVLQKLGMQYSHPFNFDGAEGVIYTITNQHPYYNGKQHF